MKKFICAVICLTLIFTLAACGKKEEEEGKLVAYKDTDGNVVTEYVTIEDSKNDEVKDMDKEVKITIPLVILDEKYRTDPDAYCKDYGFIDCKTNEKDQTITITMRSLTYDLNLARIGIQVMTNIGTAIDSGQYPYVIRLDSYTDNFDEIVVLVDGEGYKADKQNSLLSYFIGECGMFYQIYTTENEYHCTVKIKDEKTGEILDEEYYETDNHGKQY